ncbi:predicted protein [Scheffersomyces stipitis CBS 6054]|uniref:Uncharacterized protein n=1 Tax=Scheffersomyces stipitis (strain ATCC 58785 / CBS 6054 / NBRC 10063 / NRRL Y-11545) TaxID=322104 RepID=A3M0J4_PICST|nr:predicted protein [Scheffersomyces stipitis CBS 6054]ABN68717.2 predicted protein [Scheffersomyces stipitis CBS 6054]KAG2730943.1 hypothetical protein G9P44_006092 [Scheffersomyces stipitis]
MPSQILLTVIFFALTYGAPVDPLASNLAGKVVDISGEYPIVYDFSQLDLVLGVKDPIGELEMASLAGVNKEPTVERTDSGTYQILYKTNNINDLKKPKYAHLAEDKNNAFYFVDTGSSMYYDDREGQWVEIQKKDKSAAPKLKEVPYSIPVSACIDSRYGSGGSVTNQYSISISMSNSAGIGASINFMALPLGLSLTIATKVANSLSISGSYTCNIGPKQYGQLSISPKMVEVPALTRKGYYFDKMDGFVASNSKLSELAKFKILSLYPPTHYCMVDTTPKKLQCAAARGETKFFEY